MHCYTTDSNDRDKVMWLTVVLSAGLAYGTSIFFIKMNFHNFWWLDIPSVFGYYGVINYLINENAWKWKIFRKLLFIKVPNLNGVWKGTVSSSYDDHAQKRDVTVTIKQSLIKMDICFESDQSRGHSITAAILLDDVGSRTLRYEYLNEPKISAPDSMHMHRGTSRLIIVDSDTLDGDYYSGRDRIQRGLICLKRNNEP